MIDTIKCIDIKGKINTTDLFNLLKTKSLKSNNEIISILQNFNKFPDFCSYYLNPDSVKYFENFHKLVRDFSNNDDNATSSFETTIEQYISCLTKIILSLNLLLKTQEMLSKILISSKNKLNSLIIKNQIENSNHEKLINLIDNFSNIFLVKSFRSNSSTSTTFSNMSSLDSTPQNISFKNYSSVKDLEKFKFEINPENYVDEDKTPKFILNAIVEEKVENFNENDKIDKKDSALTLSQFVFVNQNNNYLENEEKQKESDNNFENLLVMINNLYKKALINAEEKIKFKKMVIGKSIKLEKFYYDIYQNSNTDKKQFIQEIKKLIN